VLRFLNVLRLGLCSCLHLSNLFLRLPLGVAFKVGSRMALLLAIVIERSRSGLSMVVGSIDCKRPLRSQGVCLCWRGVRFSTTLFSWPDLILYGLVRKIVATVEVPGLTSAFVWVWY
jgi:hypothetical protein